MAMADVRKDLAKKTPVTKQFHGRLKVDATFCPPEIDDLFSTVDWEVRSAQIKGENGELIFEQTNSYSIILPLMLVCIVSNLMARRLKPEPLHLDALRRRQQLDADDGGGVVRHIMQPARAMGRHRDVILLVGRGRQRIDAGGMGQ